MSDLSDEQLHQIVQRVLEQQLGLSKPAAGPAAAPAPVPAAAPAAAPKPTGPAAQVVAIGADHGGFELKELLKPEIVKLGYTVQDAGTHSKDPVDYPDVAHAVAKLVSAGQAGRGIIIDGAGIGSCIVANKLPGVRAGMAYDYSSALNSREHNDTNVLTLGAGLIGANLAKQIVTVWLSTPFGDGRHAPRVDKIGAVEKQYLK